ncbi:IS3 transposase [Salmonella enterica subsp. enterica]|uniref:IS3 transposase n=1 Tax=Salmonella enterica I TaxID=59201 RepID=A0A379VR22_SALET|nr:IS3 transposase [Salmonella enterica subsp. enterica]
MISPLGLMMEASVSPAPRSRIASGPVVPGVVSAPRMAASASSAADLHVDIKLLLNFTGNHRHLQTV